MKEIRIALLHDSKLLKARPARREVFDRVRRMPGVMLLGPYSQLCSECEGADFYIAHANEDGHRGELEQNCEPRELPYVLFGGIQSIQPLGRHGYVIPASLFEAHLEDFLREWMRLRQFPSWDWLIGQPEHDLCLNFLHALLSGDEILALGYRDQLVELVERSLSGCPDPKLESVWNRVKAVESIDGIRAITEYRDLLLDGDAEPGLATLLLHKRQSS